MKRSKSKPLANQRLDSLLLVGMRLANVAWHIANGTTQADEIAYRDRCRELAKLWDDAMSELRKQRRLDLERAGIDEIRHELFWAVDETFERLYGSKTKRKRAPSKRTPAKRTPAKRRKRARG